MTAIPGTPAVARRDGGGRRSASQATCLLAVVWLCVFRVDAAEPTLDIRIDQVGYLTDMPKRAMVVAPASIDRFFVVRVGASDDAPPAFESRLGSSIAEPDSGDNLRIADFSSLTEPGEYALDVPELGQSATFTIGPSVYSRALYLATRSFYGQRCGTAVDLGDGYSYPACHTRGAYHASSGKKGKRPSAKGWHDAGDYGRYVVNSGITTGTLLWAWELYSPVFAKLSLKIPESGDATPDLLDEIRWNLDWMLSMQDTDGGAWHKQTPEAFPPFVMPHKDTSTSYVIGSGSAPFKSSCATANLAAVSAIAGRIYAPYDADYAKDALSAARRAWQWLDEHPDVTFRNPKDVSTGQYGDEDCSDELLWAAVELWRSTGDAKIHSFVRQNATAQLPALHSEGPPGWRTVAPLALWGYALAQSEHDPDLLAKIHQRARKAADDIVKRSARHGYRISLVPKDYVWGSNAVVANYGMQLLVAHALEPDRRYVETALDNLHYLLGRNTFALSWVTGVGTRSFQNPHHRPSAADNLAEPWPGLLSGGPNRNPSDPAAKKLPKLPPARMYIDHTDSFATNENAINWNAALVFLLAGVSAAE